jgi:protein ImuB
METPGREGPGTAERMGIVWCPDWPVLARRRAEPGLVGVPVAVLAHGLVAAASAEARAEDVRPGIRRREAEARCSGLVLVDGDPPAEASAFEAVARAVEAFTPRVELDRPGRLGFPTRGPSRYFGGDDALGVAVAAAVAEVGVPEVRVGIADGALAAWLAARRAVPGAAFVVPPGESPAFLAPWPVTVLGDRALADLLARLGLRTLGTFAELPAPAVLARFATPGAIAHRRAQGQDDTPMDLAVPPPDLVETCEFDPPVARVDAAAFAAKTLADRLLSQLADRGLACTRVMVEAETEHGERLARCWRHEGALTPATLAERVRWQLEAWLLAGDGKLVDDDLADADLVTGGLTRLWLRPDGVVPADGRQLGFWGGDQAAADRAARALARVQGMLGHDAVVTPVVQGGRTPAERVRWVPWGDVLEPARDPSAAWPGALPDPAPARVFEPPLPAELLDAAGEPVRVSGRGECGAPPATLRSAELPNGGGRVVGWAGPWTHDVRWWDADSRRRGAHWQVVLDGGVACLVVLESGHAGLEALYD